MKESVCRASAPEPEGASTLFFKSKMQKSDGTKEFSQDCLIKSHGHVKVSILSVRAELAYP